MSLRTERRQTLEREGLTARARWNLTEAILCEEAVRRGEGLIAAEGPLVCRTGQRTPADYDRQASQLAEMFIQNFKAFEGQVSADLKTAGPRA